MKSRPKVAASAALALATTLALVHVGRAAPPEHKGAHGEHRAHPKHGKDAPQPEGNAVGQHLEAAKESLKEGGREARQALREAHKAAKEEAKEVEGKAKEGLKEARDTAKRGLSEAGDTLKEASEDAKEELGAVTEGAAEAARGIGHAMREGAMKADAARRRLWAKWKARLQGRDHIDNNMTLEFDQHARRQARLRRIAEIADEKHDAKARQRVERLMALEDQRHTRRMEQLATSAEQAKADTSAPAGDDDGNRDNSKSAGGTP